VVLIFDNFIWHKNIFSIKFEKKLAGGGSKVCQVGWELGKRLLLAHSYEVPQLPYDTRGDFFDIFNSSANRQCETFFHFVSIWRPCLESAHQLLHLLHLEKIVLILFPRYRQNLHRFYKVKISPFLVVCTTFDHFLFRSRLRRLCLARILTSKKTFRWNNSTSNANKSPLYTEVVQLSRSTNLPWKKLPGKDRGLKFPRLSGRIFYVAISLKSKKTKVIWYMNVCLHSCCYRNSSFMFYNYMGKKFVEICFIFVALFFNRWICRYL